MAGAADQAQTEGARKAFDQWLEAFLRSYYARRPVNATFIGVHEHDAQLPDYSDAGAGDTCVEMQGLLEESRRLDTSALDPVRARDLELARGFIEIELWERGSRHFERGNPATWTGEAIFGVLSLFLSDFAPLKERAEAAIARLEATPGFLAGVRGTIRDSPVAWTERALRECQGARAFLTEGVDLLVEEEGASAALRDAAEPALAAWEQLHDWLDTSLRARRRDSTACGQEALQRYLRRGHFIDADPDEIVRQAEDRLAEAVAALRAKARHLGVDDPERLLARIETLHPSQQEYYGRYQEVWEAVRARAVEADLLTWPDFPIRYVPRPRWARAAAPYLYFLYYRSPAAFARPSVHEYLVAPIDADLPRDERDRRLRAHNDEVIKLNHVIHHGSIGHHVQNWHAFRAESRIGKMAAVDCASRIAMFCGGTMAEGWACYATDLMSEAGMLTSLEQLAELRARQRMCARAIVDIRLHQGRWSLDKATEFYRREAAMGTSAAQGEAAKNSMFPGAAVVYLLGTETIHDLRRTMQRRRGADFELRAFHDEFLSHGSIPVTMIADAMLNGDEDAR